MSQLKQKDYVKYEYYAIESIVKIEMIDYSTIHRSGDTLLETKLGTRWREFLRTKKSGFIGVVMSGNYQHRYKHSIKINVNILRTNLYQQNRKLAV